MAENANTIWADGPDGAPLQPDKAKIRAWGAWLESFLTAIGSNSGSVFATRTSLFADLIHPANAMAWVVSDTTVAFNGIYQKSGASGSGSWTRVVDLPYSFIVASDIGAGTPNAILATSSVPISGSALVIMEIFEANTASPVTVSFNGGSPLTVKTNTGNDISPGGLPAGMRVLGVASGSTFRLVSDQVSASIVAAAEAAAAASLGSKNAAATSETNAGNSATLAQKWANNAEDSVVSGGLYSAFHWAQKAASYVLGSIAAAIHGATAKTTLADNDELGLADSAATYGLKKVTISNLIASIFNGSRKIASAFFLTSFRLYDPTDPTKGFGIDASNVAAGQTRYIRMADADVDFTKQAMFDAVVNFNGTGTLAVRGSKYFLGVTDNGNGQYQPNFTAAAPSTNYAVFATCRVPAAGNLAGAIVEPFSSFNGSTHQDEAPTTSSFKIKTFVPGASNAADCDYVFVGVIFFP